MLAVTCKNANIIWPIGMHPYPYYNLINKNGIRNNAIFYEGAEEYTVDGIQKVKE
jgi:hypothetical protein